MATAGLSKGERTRAALLEHAIERFAERGFKRTSLADVARSAGLSPPAVYVYFADKEALFTAAVDADAAALIEDALAPVLTGSVPIDWGRLVDVLVAAVARHPLARRVLSGLEPDHTERLLEIPALERLRSAIAELLRAEQQAGNVRRDIDPERLAIGIETAVMAMLIATLQTGVRPGDERVDGVLALFDAALFVPAPSSPRRAQRQGPTPALRGAASAARSSTSASA